VVGLVVGVSVGEDEGAMVGRFEGVFVGGVDGELVGSGPQLPPKVALVESPKSLPEAANSPSYNTS